VNTGGKNFKASKHSLLETGNIVSEPLATYGPPKTSYIKRQPTKGVYPVELVQKLSRQNEYGITLVSLDEDFRKSYEPYAAPFEERIEALRYLHEMGFKTWVSIEPYLTPNIVSQELEEILAKVSFADKIVFGRLNYNAKIRAFPQAREFTTVRLRLL